jgi:hypothetical protein
MVRESDGILGVCWGGLGRHGRGPASCLMVFLAWMFQEARGRPGGWSRSISSSRDFG